jgi:hypothetical protein
MPTRLRALTVSKVDFVDRPADPHARIAVWKRDTASTPPPGGSADPALEHTKDGEMPNPLTLTPEVRKGLNPDVLAYIEQAEASASAADVVADEVSPAADDVTKRSDVPEDVRDMIAKQADVLAEVRKQADAATALAQSEVTKREEREWGDRLAKFDGVLPEGAASKFRKMAAVDPDAVEDIIKSMDALRSQVDESALFASFGKAAPADGSPEARFDSAVSEVAKRDGIDNVDATAKVLSTPEGETLYNALQEG